MGCYMMIGGQPRCCHGQRKHGGRTQKGASWINQHCAAVVIAIALWVLPCSSSVQLPVRRCIFCAKIRSILSIAGLHNALLSAHVHGKVTNQDR